MSCLISESSRVVKVCAAAKQALASLVHVCVCVRASVRGVPYARSTTRASWVPTSPYLLFLRVYSPLFRLNGPLSPSQAHRLQSLTSLIPDPARLPDLQNSMLGLHSGSCRHENQAFENSTVKFAF